MQSDHPVLHCHAVQKGLLVVKEVGVGEPEMVCYAVVQGQVQFQLAISQAFISPALLEIHCDGVVLGRGEKGVGPAMSNSCLPIKE